MSRSPFPVPRLVVGGVPPSHAVLAALPPIPRRLGSSSTHPTPSWQLFHPSHAVLAALPPIPRRLGSSSTHPTPSWQLFHPSHAVLAALPPIPRRLGSSSTHPTPSGQLDDSVAHRVGERFWVLYLSNAAPVLKVLKHFLNKRTPKEPSTDVLKVLKHFLNKRTPKEPSTDA